MGGEKFRLLHPCLFPRFNEDCILHFLLILARLINGLPYEEMQIVSNFL